MLFASHRKGNGLSGDIAAVDVDNKATYRLYYFELYASGSETPKHRLMPARRKSDSVAGLYETVTGRFYGPAGNSGSFTTYCSLKNIAARQRYPWNGLVDLHFTLAGDSGVKYETSFTAKDMAGGTNITMATVRKADGAAANAAKESLLPGDYRWVWDAAADLPDGWQGDRVTVTGTAVDATYSVKFNANGGTGTMANESFTYGTAKALTANAFTRTGYTFQGWATSASGSKVYSDKQSVSNLTTSGGVVNLYAVWESALYMVIDLSSGASSSKYTISYLDAVPSGGFNVDAYKTTKIVLKRLAAGTFKMQGKQNVKLTKPLFCGLFEVTQRQYELVMGSNPCSSTLYGRGDTYPVHFVSYDMIRGSSSGAKWPSSSAVDSSSFMGKLRARTGLDFDLPTEAQWEYACRAGTTTTYSYGNSENGDYMWVANNSGGNAHPVGSKKANPWGLYDMHGNVWERCLDWYGTLAYGTDPKGSSSYVYGRVGRGGCWKHNGSESTSSYRIGNPPSEGYDDYGFRIVVTLSN